MKIEESRKKTIIIITILVVGIICCVLVNINKNKGIKYTRQGYGGFERVDENAQVKPKTPLEDAQSAYDKGNYKKAEAEAEKIIEKAKTSADPKIKKESAKARYIMAFSSARRKDLKDLGPQRRRNLQTCKQDHTDE